MRLRITAEGKFDRVGWQEIGAATVDAPPVGGEVEVPFRHQIKILWMKVTIVGRVRVRNQG